MASFPPVQSVQRAFRLLTEINTQQVMTVGELHKRTALPKPTIIRLLETLVKEGYISGDRRFGGYQVTSQVETLSSGYHGAPLVIEAARPWAIDLTRRLKWPTATAVLDRDAVVVRFSTIADSPISPFHATLNMRLSLGSHALGRAYLAFCPKDERQLLIHMVSSGEKRPSDFSKFAHDLAKSIQRKGYAERDPRVEPQSSNTIAVPIMADGRVLATFGICFFRSAVSPAMLKETLVPALKEAQREIERSVQAMRGG